MAQRVLLEMHQEAEIPPITKQHIMEVEVVLEGE
jgi:hypothetical protein